MADRLDEIVVRGEPEKAKALLRVPIAELRVNCKTDIQPTYRVLTPDRILTAGVCATSEKSGRHTRKTKPAYPRRSAARGSGR
jgi:hypothetical protein